MVACLRLPAQRGNPGRRSFDETLITVEVWEGGFFALVLPHTSVHGPLCMEFVWRIIGLRMTPRSNLLEILWWDTSVQP